MKKTLLILSIIGVTVLVFGAAGFAYAQNQTPPVPEYPYGQGMMGGFGRGMHALNGVDRDGDPDSYGPGYGHGMMGWNGEYGPMHESMVAALAETLELPVDEIEARHESGETLWEIAETEGLTADEIRELMSSAHDIALEDAVANGWMSEEQAEWMDDHMEQRWLGDGTGTGFGGHCGDGGWMGNTRWQGEN